MDVKVTFYLSIVIKIILIKNISLISRKERLVIDQHAIMGEKQHADQHLCNKSSHTDHLEQYSIKQNKRYEQ